MGLGAPPDLYGRRSIVSAVECTSTFRMVAPLLFRLLGLFLLLALAIALNLCAGDVFFTPAQAFAALSHTQAQTDASGVAGLHDIIWQIRLPRLLIAAL